MNSLRRLLRRKLLVVLLIACCAAPPLETTGAFYAPPTGVSNEPHATTAGHAGELAADDGVPTQAALRLSCESVSDGLLEQESPRLVHGASGNSSVWSGTGVRTELAALSEGSGALLSLVTEHVRLQN